MRIIVGITGATGAIYGIRLLQVLRHIGDVETHLVVSSAGAICIDYETDWQLDDVYALADVVHENSDITASIGSGSFKRDAMIVAPCSMKSLSAICYSNNDNIITRSADATLKEHKTLVLVVRETPLHLGHIRTMAAVAESGAIILPPMPAFYSRPKNVEDIVNHTVGKILDVVGVEADIYPRWEGIY